MMKAIRWVLVVGVAAALVGCGGRKPPKPTRPSDAVEQDYVLLNQRLAPEDGTWEQPVEEIGRAGGEPWSASTLKRAVDGEPPRGRRHHAGGRGR